ncbi:MAG: hypothetical protein MUC42_12600 [Bryobacter sp.]|jgi:hypothetical protein|nr:hypothetical protein [Bryobacter sp.]
MKPAPLPVYPPTFPSQEQLIQVVLGLAALDASLPKPAPPDPLAPVRQKRQ